jgi:flagellar basal-body rod protein FlgB
MPNVPIISLLKQRLAHETTAQSVTADNIARSNVPGAKAMELEDFSKSLKHAGGKQPSRFHMAITNPHHMKGHGTQAAAHVRIDPTATNATPDGNTIDIKQQMEKATQQHDQHKETLGLYSKFTALYKTMIASK